MSKLFNLENPVWNFLGKLVDMMILTGLWLICCIPVVTIGASTTALYSVTLKMAENKEGYIVSSFFRAFKENWKQSPIAWIVIALLGIFLASDLYFYYHMETRVSVVLLTIFGILTLVYLLTVTYFFPLLAKCDTDLKHLAVMAFVMALKNIGWTIFMLVITAAILAIGVFVMAPVLVIGIGLAAYVNSKIFQMIFKEYHLQTA